MPDELDNPSAQLLERKLATILSADVAEFSRLMGEDEEQTMRVFQGHKEVFESLVAMHRGRVFNTAGDAILAEFVSAVEAVRCATDIQAALRTLNDKLPPNRQVRFRIGINLGDVMVQGQDLMGDGVNVAARLQTAAEPGGICISGSVHDQITNKLSLSYQSLGEMNFKNIQTPVRTFSITHAQGHGDLPSPKPRGRAGRSAWIVAGFLLLAVLAGAAYWSFTARERSKAELAPAPSPAQLIQPEVKPPETAPPTESAVKNNASSPSSETKAKTAGNTRPPNPHPDSQKTATAAVVPSVASSSVSSGQFDGVYSGPICYGETRKLPERCYEAKGTISGTQIAGQWMMGPQKKIRATLTGNVSKSGDVKIEIVQTDPDGRPATINFTGTLRGGLITANGSFLMGRPATLNWRKNSSAPD